MRTVTAVLAASLVLATSAWAQIPDDGDLLLWIGEDSGTTAQDLSGNGNDGALFEGAKWVPGKYGQGVSLEAVGSYLEIPGGVLTPSGTLAFWFRPNWDGTDDEDYRLFDASFNGIYFFIGKGSAHADITPTDFGFYFEDLADADWQDVEFDPADIIKRDEWFHVAATWEFPGEPPYLYINGEELATSPKPTGGFPVLYELPRFGTETILYIPITNGADGVIDEIALYGRPLEAEDLEGIMEGNLAVEAEGKLAATWGRLKADR